ncbi:DNA helicase PIF1, ATP-dependent [Tanacetum coccineum]
MSAKDYNNKLHFSSSSSTFIYDNDDIPCHQKLNTENSSVEPTKAALAADCSQPKERRLENLLIWAWNRKNNVCMFSPVLAKYSVTLPQGIYKSFVFKDSNLPLYSLEVVVADDTTLIVVMMFNDTSTELIKCSAESLMGADDEGTDADDDSNLPTSIRNLIGTTHVLEIKSHTYYEYCTFKSFTCWKINPSEPVEDGASSSTPTLTADDAVPSMKRLSRHPTVCTPLEPEDSNVDEVCGPADKKKKRQRYIEDDSESA